jgi:hypothetical protein
MKPRIYTDTSVIGGCLDMEFASSSLQLFENFKSGSAIIVVSSLTLLELEDAPAMVQAVLKGVSVENIEYVEFTKEAGELAQLYISEGVIGEKSRVDAQHIATATVSRVDVLVSWNFKHIVNLQRIHAYNAVNLKYGYPLLEIRTPQEVIRYGEE